MEKEKNELDFKALNDIIEEQECRLAEQVDDKVQLVRDVYNMALDFTKGSPGVSIKYVLHEPFVTTGAVRVVADRVVISNPRKLSFAIQLSETFEIYPLTSGKVQMNFGFSGLVRPVE